MTTYPLLFKLDAVIACPYCNAHLDRVIYRFGMLLHTTVECPTCLNILKHNYGDGWESSLRWVIRAYSVNRKTGKVQEVGN